MPMCKMEGYIQRKKAKNAYVQNRGLRPKEKMPCKYMLKEFIKGSRSS